MTSKIERLRFVSALLVLVLFALILIARLVYFALVDPLYFPLNRVKVAANYQHITRAELESVLSAHLGKSFFSLSTKELQTDLMKLTWAQSVEVKRVWPDTLKIQLIERVPIAVWNNVLMSADGTLFAQEKDETVASVLPQLRGPQTQQKEVLQIYKKLSKLLVNYGLSVASLQLSESQAWELSLMNGIVLRLGKRDLEERLHRFCRAYPAVFADKPEQLSSVDLRYARGMAVQWKQQTGR
ncbi:MAG: cell division protein FtsQ/DivIB [Legionellaceae bacterium]